MFPNGSRVEVFREWFCCCRLIFSYRLQAEPKNLLRDPHLLMVKSLTGLDFSVESWIFTKLYWLCTQLCFPSQDLKLEARVPLECILHP